MPPITGSRNSGVPSVSGNPVRRNPFYEDMVVLSECSETEANVLSTILSNAEIAFHKQETGDRDPPDFSSERSDCCMVMYPMVLGMLHKRQCSMLTLLLVLCMEKGKQFLWTLLHLRNTKKSSCLESRTKKLLNSNRPVCFIHSAVFGV